MATRGVRILQEAGIDHEILTYRYVRMGAQIAADALGLPHKIVLKSLVFRADDGSFLFILIGGDANVSTRKAGRATGHKHVEAASPRDAERVTGYRVGGISPLGSKTSLPVLLDREAAAHEWLVVNAGARGTLVRIPTDALIRVTDATVADLRTG